MKRWKLTRALSALLAMTLLLAAAPQLTLTAHAASGACGEHLTWSFDEASGTLTISGYGEMEDFENYDLYDQYGNYSAHFCNIPWKDDTSRITNIRLPDGLTGIGENAFLDCARLRSVAIPDSVRRIGGFSFAGCSVLQSVTIPNGVPAVESNVFANCAGLQNVVIPDSVTSIAENAFSECASLKSVSIPNGVTGIGWGAFCGCTGLQSVSIPSKVRTIESYAFAYCTSLASISLPDQLETVGCDVFEDTAYSQNKNKWSNGLLYLGKWLIDAQYGITAANIKSGIVGIAEGVFDGKDTLQSVTFPEGMEFIGLCAFRRCERLSKVDLPSSVQRVGAAAFLDTAYYNNRNNWSNGLLYAGGWLIDSDLEIASANVRPGTKGIADEAFCFRDRLTGAALPEGLCYIGSHAFYSCGILSRVSIPNSVVFIGECAFCDCYNLRSISIPNGLTDINPSVFGWCYALSGLTIPGSVTSIGDYAFSSCDDLTHLVVPESVTSIGRWAFSGLCEKGRSLLILNRDCAIYDDSNDFGDPATTTLYGYPGSTAEAYAAKYGYAFQNLEEASFIDVSSGAYYAEPVAWAVEKGVTNGTSPYLFSPDATCTRAQVVTFLWRAAGEPEPGTDSNPFADVAEGQYYYKAVLWAVEQGITTGTSADKFSPNSGCTRGQVVTFLWRAEGKPEPASSTHPFTDVKAGEYYEKPVIWAVENGITTGTSTSLFSPSATCTRAQIVTFLYRAAGQA